MTNETLRKAKDLDFWLKNLKDVEERLQGDWRFPIELNNERYEKVHLYALELVREQIEEVEERLTAL